jgi:hypothetical protein
MTLARNSHYCICESVFPKCDCQKLFHKDPASLRYPRVYCSFLAHKPTWLDHKPKWHISYAIVWVIQRQCLQVLKIWHCWLDTYPILRWGGSWRCIWQWVVSRSVGRIMSCFGCRQTINHSQFFSRDVDHLDVVGELNPGLLVPGGLRMHRQSISTMENSPSRKLLYHA